MERAIFKVSLILADGERELGNVEMSSPTYGTLTESDAVNNVLDGITTRPALGLMQWGAESWPAVEFRGVRAALLARWVPE